VKEKKTISAKYWLWIAIIICVIIAIPYLVVEPLINWNKSDWSDKTFSIGIILFVVILAGSSVRRKK
jgi:hypothetical protein